MLMYIWIRSQRFLVFIAVLVAADVALAHTPRVNDKADLVGKSFSAKDTLKPGEDPNQDAQQCLDGLCWTPVPFQVDCEKSDRPKCDALVRFPSPKPSGFEAVDRVAMEWYHARDPEGDWIKAPAMIVIHESGSGMDVGRTIAYALSRTGVHAFLLQLPGYGERRGERDMKVDHFLQFGRQGIADARRARDAVVGLPKVDGECIGLQGTSLGGFIGATSAALDDVYDHVFLMLAGGQLYEVLQTGQRDAAQIRTRLAEAGLSGEVLRKGLFSFEPTRLAHRLSAQKTWLFSGKFDTVVKLRYAQALSEKIGLEEEHHVIMACDHYSGILQLPQLIFRMRETLAGQPFESEE